MLVRAVYISELTRSLTFALFISLPLLKTNPISTNPALTYKVALTTAALLGIAVAEAMGSEEKSAMP